MMLFELFVVIFAVLLCIWLVRYHWSKRKLYEFSWKTTGPFSWPFIGNALMFSGNTEVTYNNLKHVYTAYPTPSRGWLGPDLWVFISKPKDLEVILNTSQCLGKVDVYKFIKTVTGDGIFTAPVNIWKAHRKIISPAFSQKILDTFVDIFVQQGNIAIEKIKRVVGKGEVDIFEYVSLCMMDIFCESAMGIKVHAQTKESRIMKTINRVLNMLFVRATCLWYQFDFIFYLLPIGFKFTKFVSEFHNFTDTVIKQKQDEFNKQKSTVKTETVNGMSKAQGDIDIGKETLKRKPFLQLLMELSEVEKKFTDKELRDEVNTFMLTGTESTSATSSFVLMMLASHQDIQEKVYKEIEEVLGDTKRQITVEDIPKFRYLERVIKETMRIFPIGPFIARAITEDTKLESCVIPAGSSALLGIIMTHRDPELWPDPLKFDPDRFLPDEVAKRHPYSYIPFSGGPRNCIGIRYAYMTMKVFLANFLRHYKVKGHYKPEDIRLKLDTALKPVNGHLVRVEFRD